MTPEEASALHRAAFGAKGWPAEDFAAFARDPAAILVTRPGALALLRLAFDEAEVLTLATDPAQRRRGFGRALLSEALAAARQRGARSVFLEVDARNGAARGLYAALGFAEVARRRGYYRDEDGTRSDALILRLDL